VKSTSLALVTVACVGLAAPFVGRAQDSRDLVRQVAEANDLRGPFPLSPVLDAPFIADAILTIADVTPAGAKRQWTTARHLYRDSTGRARVDYEVPLSNVGGKTRFVAVILPEPKPVQGRVAYMADPETRTLRKLPRDLMNGQFSGWAQFDIPVGLADFRTFGVDLGATGNAEPIGERRIEGLRAVGWRLTGGADPTQPDERWESPELKMVLRAHFVDDRSHAEIDYRLTNIRRMEPDAQLFEVPTDYTIVTTGPLIGQSGDPLYRSAGPRPDR
jgi:hypothetical protein